MQKQNEYKLIFKSRITPISSNFPYLSDVNIDVYISLITEGMYQVKSIVEDDVFDAFIEHWINKKVPVLQVDNISDFQLLSEEFDRMKNIIQTFQRYQSNSHNTLIKKQKEDSKKKIISKRNIIDQKMKNYQKIISIIFERVSLNNKNSKFLEIREKLYRTCYKEDIESIDFMTRKNPKQENLEFVLNDDNSELKNDELKKFTFFFGCQAISMTFEINSRRFKEVKSKEVLVSLFHTNTYNVKSKVSYEILKNFLDYWNYGNLPPLNIDNIFGYCMLSKEFEIMSEYLLVPEYKYILALSFLINEVDEKNGDRNESLTINIESFISSNLDYYLENFYNKMYKIKMSSLFKIFYHKDRKLVNHQKAYHFITKIPKENDNDDSNIIDFKQLDNTHLILLGSLDRRKFISKIENLESKFSETYLKIREIEEKDYIKLTQMLEESGDDTNNFYETRYFMQSSLSKGYVCEVRYSPEISEILGMVYGNKIAKCKKLEDLSTKDEKEKVKEYFFYKFQINILYVKEGVLSQSQIYIDLVDYILEEIKIEKIDSLINEVNLTIRQNILDQNEPLLKYFKDKDFFNYESLIRYYDMGESNIKMKKFFSYPEEYLSPKEDYINYNKSQGV